MYHTDIQRFSFGISRRVNTCFCLNYNLRSSVIMLTVTVHLSSSFQVPSSSLSLDLMSLPSWLIWGATSGRPLTGKEEWDERRGRWPSIQLQILNRYWSMIVFTDFISSEFIGKILIKKKVVEFVHFLISISIVSKQLSCMFKETYIYIYRNPCKDYLRWQQPSMDHQRLQQPTMLSIIEILLYFMNKTLFCQILQLFCQFFLTREEGVKIWHNIKMMSILMSI